MTGRAMSSLMPGISPSRWTAGSTGPSGLVLASGSGGPVSVDAPGGGHRRGQFSGPGGEPGDLAIEEGDLVQQLGELAVVVIEHAGQGLDQLLALGFHASAGQGGQLARVAFPGDHGPDHVLG